MAQMELAVLDFIQELFRNPFMDSLMPAVTSLGDAGFLWILLGLALLCSRKYRRTGAAKQDSPHAAGPHISRA